MKYEYHVKRPAGSDFNPGDIIINRDESRPGAISLLKWLQSKFGRENVTLWKVTSNVSLQQMEK